MYYTTSNNLRVKSYYKVDNNTITFTVYYTLSINQCILSIIDDKNNTLFSSTIAVTDCKIYDSAANLYKYIVSFDLTTISFECQEFDTAYLCFSHADDTYQLTSLSFTTTNSRSSIINIPDEAVLTMKAIRDLIYPIGSIYTSMNDMNPGLFIGGTWTQIVDKFMYCSNMSLATGGSKKISVDNLPPHDHKFVCVYDTAVDKDGNPDGAADSGNDRGYWRYGTEYANYTSYTHPTGIGTDYMPPYITVFAWYRTA